MMDLFGAVSIVTGATGGIGGAIALALAETEGRLVITGRRRDELAALGNAVEERGGEAVVVEGDISSAATASRVVEAALERFGRIDLLVNSAGYGPPMPLVDMPEDVWNDTIGSCLTGAYLMTRAALPAMLQADAGRIVQVSSIAGKAVEGNRTAYCAAQWGLQGFCMALQAELGPTGVRVHLISPGSVATDWWTTTRDPQPEDVLGKMMTAEDIAGAMLWMLSLPDHVQIDDLIIHNTRSPWSA